MDTDQNRKRVAEPAEEEIKKHGDQLETQVADAAGKPVREEKRKEEGRDNTREP